MAKNIYALPRMVLIALLCSINFYSFSQSLSWVQQIGNPNNLNSEVGVITSLSDLNNDTYFIGSFKGTVDFDNSSSVNTRTSVGPFDMFLLKEDANGNFLWVKQFPCLSNSPNSGLFPKNMTTDNNGNIYVTGAFEDSVDFDPSPNVYKMYSYGVFSSVINTFVLKLTHNGDFVWAKQMGGVTLNTSWGQGVKIDVAGNIYMVSNFSGTIDADPDSTVLPIAGSGILIHKLNNNGNLLWVKHLAGNCRVWSFSTDSFFNLVIAGQFDGVQDFDPSANTLNLTADGGYDIFTEKFDSSGNYLWVKQIGSTGDDVAQGVGTDKSGNVLVTGYFSGTADFNSGSVVNNLSPSGTRDAFVLKLNNNGLYQWAYNFGGGGMDHGVTISSDSSNNVITTGDFQGQADFNPGIGVNNITSQGSYDVFIQKLDSTGNFIWVDEIGSTGYDMPVCFSIDGANNYYVSGSIGEAGFSGIGDFDPGLGITTLSGNNDGFIEKLCNSNPLQLNTNSTVFCEGDTALLYTPPMGNTAFQWVKDGNVIPNFAGDTLKVTQTGSYTVAVLGNSCSESAPFYLSLLPITQPTISITANATVPAGQQATVTANLNGFTSSFLIHWYINGQMFTTNNNATFSYTKGLGIDTIHASLVVQAPCYDTAVSGYWYIQSIDAIANIHTQSQFLIYPNPATTTLFIQTQQAGSLVLMDITGRVILQSSIINPQSQIDISSLAKGVYLLRFSSNEGAVETVKVVKE